MSLLQGFKSCACWSDCQVLFCWEQIFHLLDVLGKEVSDPYVAIEVLYVHIIALRKVMCIIQRDGDVEDPSILCV
jgi:hypothetical protein